MIVFVSDFFKEDHAGGAELTSEALIEKCPLPVIKLHSHHCTKKHMHSYKDYHWVFGNFYNLDTSLLLHAYKNLEYSVIEYDYKFCKFRCEELHEMAEGKCECHKESHGKLISIFFKGAKSLWWMSQGQRDKYHSKFPFLKNKESYVLSSIFSLDTLKYISLLKEKKGHTNKWLIMNSSSKIKGVREAIEYAIENNLEYELVGDLPHKEFLKKMQACRGLLFLPIGSDTCPRMVIEAKLLGKELIINDHVQHKDETWFSSTSTREIEEYLSSRPLTFWKKIEEISSIDTPIGNNLLEKNHFTIIIPAYNCAPWVEKNVLSALNQKYGNFNIIYIDDDSEDATYDLVSEIKDLYDKEDRLNIIRNKKNYKALYNINNAIKQVRDDSIIVLLDGDDWLSSFNVLARLNEEYDKETWITAGTYIESTTCRVVKSANSDDAMWNGNLRKYYDGSGHPNVFSHLRTFRKKLFDKIDKSDLKDEDGKFYQCTFDRALMYPMLEMAGQTHYKSIDQIVYTYNRLNPLSVDRVQRRDQLRIEAQIRKKSQYERLKSL
tara:strand:+ start:5546 stop:7192 length:1647 start_codon:yes stop_codon:yes gene_type:complete